MTPEQKTEFAKKILSLLMELKYKEAKEILAECRGLLDFNADNKTVL